MVLLPENTYTMLMVFPVNFLSAYVGFPILIGLAIDFYLRYRKKQTTTSFYMTFACLLAAFSQMLLALPILFTTDTKTLSFYAYFADIFLTTSFLFVWLFAIHALLGTRPKIARFATVFVFLLAIACYVSAFFLNLTPPYSTTVGQTIYGSTTVIFRNSLDYIILYSLNRISLLFAGFYLFMQGNNAPTSGQKLRIRSFATLIILGVATSAILPIVEVGVFNLNDLILSSAFLLCGIMAIVGHILDKKK